MFDSAGFRRNFLDAIRTSKGLAALNPRPQDDADANRRTAFDRIADALEASVDMRRIAALAHIKSAFT